MRPMVRQLEARNSLAEADGEVSSRSGMSRALRKLLFGRDQRRAARLRYSKRLIEIGDDVVDVLDADREPNQIRLHAGLELLLRRHLPMRRRSWMACKRFRIAQIDQSFE